jgi:hypothetical protein
MVRLSLYRLFSDFPGFADGPRVPSLFESCPTRFILKYVLWSHASLPGHVLYDGNGDRPAGLQDAGKPLSGDELKFSRIYVPMLRRHSEMARL